jgi:GMP synthase-like glutamine amidotransferase
MRLKKIAKLFVVSIVTLTGSPAFAAQIARHDGYCRSCVQKADGCRHRTFGTCVGRESDAPRWSGRNTTHDNWSAGMILG